jgi:hypothetical protein
MYFWCRLKNGVAWSTSTSRPARPRSGLRNNCGRHFLSTQIPRYLLRYRDKIFSDDFRRQVADMNIQEVLSARPPWQRASVERLIGSIRCEWLDNVIVFDEASLCRMLSVYCSYYDETRPTFPRKRPPEPRKVQPRGAGPSSGGTPSRGPAPFGTSGATPEAISLQPTAHSLIGPVCLVMRPRVFSRTARAPRTEVCIATTGLQIRRRQSAEGSFEFSVPTLVQTLFCTVPPQ